MYFDIITCIINLFLFREKTNVNTEVFFNIIVCKKPQVSSCYYLLPFGVNRFKVEWWFAMQSPRDKKSMRPLYKTSFNGNKTISLNVFYCGNCTVDLIPIYFQRNTSFKMSRIRHRNYRRRSKFNIFAYLHRNPRTRYEYDRRNYIHQSCHCPHHVIK